MKQDKIVLIDNELIIREDVTLYELCVKFNVLNYITPTHFIIKEGYSLNGVHNIIPQTLTSSDNPILMGPIWTMASLEGYFTFDFLPRNNHVDGVFFRRYNPGSKYEQRPPFIKLESQDRLFFDDFPDMGIEFCQHKTGGIERITNFYSIDNPDGRLIIPMP